MDELIVPAIEFVTQLAHQSILARIGNMVETSQLHKCCGAIEMNKVVVSRNNDPIFLCPNNDAS
ncbi:MAG: hypothetical protein CL681_01635 [Blastopirellula sp.]|nr:hypothetical protein [Blastopirellula sp.]MAR08660.1 hypothetical protein [Blastopirellula sp.]